jgi:hypothetical protein
VVLVEAVKGFSRLAGGYCFFLGGEPAEIVLSAICRYARKPFASVRIPPHADSPACIIGSQRSVLPVLRRINLAQVGRPVVSTDAVDVVNLMRPATVLDSPRHTMRADPDTEDAALQIPAGR